MELEDFELALASKPVEAKGPVTIERVSIDTRTLAAGDAFFAIRGRNLDGHRFVNEAKAKGASAFVVEKRSWEEIRPVPLHNVFLVDDTTVAFGDLARYVRRKSGVKSLAVTGSCGKTTTKQIAGLLLRRRFELLATEGNFNNQFGLPLTILKLKQAHEILLAEIGASRPGDIAYLSEILEPAVGLVTNVYPAHLEGFGSLDKVYETKLELAGYLAKNGGTLIVNGDNAELARRSRTYGAKVVTYGREKRNDYVLNQEVRDGEIARFKLNGRYGFGLRTHAQFNTDNFAGALVLAHEAGVPLEQMEGVLEDFHPVPGRFEKHVLDSGVCVIHDAYNANPGSMIQALTAFAGWENLGKRKIAVLSDMLELGAESEALHRRVGKQFAELGIDMLVTVGARARGIAEAAREAGACPEILSFDTNSEAVSFLASSLRAGDAVLLKGSRSTKLEEILNALKS